MNYLIEFEYLKKKQCEIFKLHTFLKNNIDQEEEKMRGNHILPNLDHHAKMFLRGRISLSYHLLYDIFGLVKKKVLSLKKNKNQFLFYIKTISILRRVSTIIRRRYINFRFLFYHV